MQSLLSYISYFCRFYKKNAELFGSFEKSSDICSRKIELENKIAYLWQKNWK